MANIASYLNDIADAVQGEDVRWSIHDGIQAINNEVVSTTAKVTADTNSAQAYAATASQKATAAQTAATQAQNAQTAAAQSATSAQTSATQAGQYYQNITGMDLEAAISLGEELAKSHSITTTLTDSSGNVIVDSSGNVIVTKTMFVEMSAFNKLQETVTNILKDINANSIILNRLQIHAILDSGC